MSMACYLSLPPVANPLSPPTRALVLRSLAPSSLAPSSLTPSSLAPSSLAPSSLAPSSLAPSSLALKRIWFRYGYSGLWPLVRVS